MSKTHPFDLFVEAHGHEYGSVPEAFAAWLAGQTGEPVTGVELDLSGAVYATPQEEER